MPASKRVKHLILPALLALSGCGGGGGGSGSGPVGTAPPVSPPVLPPVQPPAPLPPLVLAEADTFRLPQDALTASNATLAAGHFAVDMAQRFQTKGAALSQKVPCSEGEMIATLTDTDGDGIAGAGDRLSIQANTCVQGMLDDPALARLNVDLQAGTLLGEGKLTALVQFEQGSSVSPESMHLAGSFMFAWERTPLAQSWRVSASSKDDLQTIPRKGSAAFLRAPFLTKTVDYVTARSQVSLAMRYESNGGSVQLSTPVPLSFRLNHDAEQGTVEFRGANGMVRVTTESADGGYDLAVANLLLGDSTVSAKTEKYAWLGFTGNFLWWDGYRRDFDSKPLLTLSPGSVDRYLSIADPARFDAPDAVFRLQFSPPPAALPQLFYRFADFTLNSPMPPPNVTPLPSVSAAAEVHGALVLLRPAQALGPGRVWELQASRDGVTWSELGKPAPDIVLSDVEGHQITLYGGNVGAIQTPGAR
jgi:hypothetical protein